ncbi:MAG: hypothetical protein OEW48_19400, partial [Phycisphaerae bacterium]|nr:hypothetical protein [Phycisphaerae bacterium]
TDEHGHAPIPLQRPHTLTAAVGKKDFCSLLIVTKPLRKGELYHNIDISWQAPERPSNYQHFNIRDAKANKISLSLYMPKKGGYEPPPYPGYTGY